jgi:tRNA-specific 2-thiouridylase
MGKFGRKNQKKVICAMSGGIDSSVAAALLKRAGFNVIGVFMKFWSEPQKDGIIGTSNRCCPPEAEVRARKVAKILKIPFYVFDFSKEFKERIVNYFLEGYKKGITPNPCVVCNKEIKFGLLLEKALKLGADFVATGHYARKKEIRENSYSNSYRFAILRAKDKEKDQSYFLWMLNQKQLKRILFPVGNYKRKEVENLAKKFKLPILKAKKSVEICFIQTTINDFLKKYLKEKPGKIIDTKGKILGEHKGLWFYTIGQRRGILLSGGPWWVLKKDLKKNLLIVTKNKRELLEKELICKNVHWTSGKEPKLPLKVKTKIRYQSKFVLAKIYKMKNKKYRLIFAKPQQAITPGQSVVFYKGQEVLGGGIIC